MALPFTRTHSAGFLLRAMLGIPIAIGLCLVAITIIVSPFISISTTQIVFTGLAMVYLLASLMVSVALKEEEAPDWVYWAGLALGTPPWLALFYFGVLR